MPVRAWRFKSSHPHPASPVARRLPPGGARLAAARATRWLSGLASPLESGPGGSRRRSRRLTVGRLTRTSLARLWRRGPVSRGSLVRGTACRAACDDDELVDELVLRVALLVLGALAARWLALSLAIVSAVLSVRAEPSRGHGPAPLSDARGATGSSAGLRGHRVPNGDGGVASRAPAPRAGAPSGRSAVDQTRARRCGPEDRGGRDPDARRHRRRVGDRPPARSAAAWRRVSALAIASELERLAPAPGAKLLPLLRDWNPAVRFWGATLLRPVSGSR